MNDQERDQMLIEVHQDIKWIKCWIAEQNKYHLMIYAALVGALIGIIV